MIKFQDRLKAIDRYAKGLLPELAPFVVAQVQDNITDKKTPPNAPLTKALKGDKGPLKETGEMRASITFYIEGDRLIVGTPLKRAPILHYGGTVTAKTAKKLAIPAAKNVKRWVEARGVRGFINYLEGQGWQILWRDKSVLGRPPKGAKARFGVKLKDGSRLLFIRKKSVEIPARPFARLRARQMAELRRTAEEYRDKVIR